MGKKINRASAILEGVGALVSLGSVIVNTMSKFQKDNENEKDGEDKKD